MSECYHILDDDKKFPGIQEKLGSSLQLSRTYREGLVFMETTPKVDILFLDGYLDNRLKGTDFLSQLDMSGLIDKVDTIVPISNSPSMNMTMVNMLTSMDPGWVTVDVSHPVIKRMEGLLFGGIPFIMKRKEIGNG